MPPSSYAVITIDKHGSILSANQSAVKIFGYSQQEMLGQKINMLMPSPYAEQHDSYLKQYQDTKVPHIIGTNRVVTILTKRGETKNVSLAVSEAETARGTIFIGLLQKVEDTRVVVDTDSEGLIYAVKGNVFLTFGYHKQELLGKNISIFCPEAIRSEHDRYMKNYKTGQQKNSKVVGKIRNLTAMHKTSTEPIEISLAVKRATLRVHEKCGGGVIKEISGFRGTITPVENMEAMVTLSLRGQILTVSENFCLMFGYSKGEMEGKHIVRLMKENPRDLFPKTTLGKSVTEKIQCIHKDKSVFIADITIHRAVPSEGADSTLKEEVFVCKIGRTSSKKPNKELISSGDHLGMYTYGRILGSGYFGKVRMAYHRITGCKVAIKTLRKKQYLAVNMEYPPREITVLKSLDHPHLNRLYDTVELPDRFHLVLEYVEGKELCDVVESGSPTEDQIRKYWRQILLAVAYMHSNGIVHRDLKLENIIIDKNDNVKIIDFGFGNFMLNENHVLRTFCGSPDYAAPELFFGKAYNGFRVDCWSLGVLLFALFSKKFPFRDSTAVMNVELAFPPSIPKKGRDLISKILVKNAEERFTVEDMLAHPWTNIGYPGPPEQPLPLFNVSVDNEVLDKMKELGLETSTTVKSLQHREFNQFTTTYFLLKEKKNKRVERQSSGQSDLSEGSDDSNSESGSSRKRDECVLL